MNSKAMKMSCEVRCVDFTVLFTVLLHLAIISRPASEELTRSPDRSMWLFGCKLCRYVCRYGRLSSLSYSSLFYMKHERVGT